MVNIENYINKLIELLKRKFGARLLYVGLQGSYLRGEASDNSDLDIMVVINTLNVTDLDSYRSIIQSLEHYDKSCGFICSKTDLASWNPLEIFHLTNSTKDYFGVLNDLVPTYTDLDIKNFIKLSLNNLYHEICHRYIHADLDCNIESLPFTFKGVFFILQNIFYLKNGIFIRTKFELLPLLSDVDYAVLNRSIEINNGLQYDFHESFELLFNWCQKTLNSL